MLFSTLEGAGYLCGCTILTEYYNFVAAYIEASAAVGVVALHQLGFAVLDVVGGKGELESHTIRALCGCCAEGGVRYLGFDVFGYAEAHFIEVFDETIGGPVGAFHGHRIAVVADGVVGLGVGSTCHIEAEQCAFLEDGVDCRADNGNSDGIGLTASTFGVE